MTTIVFVSNSESGDISVLGLDLRDGALSPLQTIEVGGMVMPLAVSPDRRFLYAARRRDPMAVVSLGIDLAHGRLTRLGESPLPASMAYIATDRSGRFLFSASYPGSLIAVSAIASDGVAQAAHQVLPTGPNAHSIRADPSNRYVFATALGGGHLLQLRFDAASGLLAPNDPARVDVRAGAGPRHLDFHPNGRFVYLLNELDASLDVWSLDSVSGTLAHAQTIDTLPPGFDGKPWAADLHLTPDRCYLYSSERRSSTLAAFRVDASTGLLALIGHYATQTQPRGFAIDPSGRFVLAAGERSRRIGVHAIAPASGALESLHEVAAGRGPNLKQPVIVDNKGGAGGVIGADAVAKSQPDGYTLLLGTIASHAINPALRPKMPYDAAKDFAPIILLGSISNVLLVGAEQPFKKPQDIIAAAKAKPGSIPFASAGQGSSQHMSGEVFKLLTGAELTHVPYKGSAPAIQDVISGHLRNNYS